MSLYNLALYFKKSCETLFLDDDVLCLQEKVEHLRAESESMRRREREVLASHNADTEQRVQRAVSQFQQLPQEIDSLRAVLEMRNQEIRELRSKNAEIEKQVTSSFCSHLLTLALF